MVLEWKREEEEKVKLCPTSQVFIILSSPIPPPLPKTSNGIVGLQLSCPLHRQTRAGLCCFPFFSPEGGSGPLRYCKPMQAQVCHSLSPPTSVTSCFSIASVFPQANQSWVTFLVFCIIFYQTRRKRRMWLPVAILGSILPYTQSQGNGQK